MVSNRKLPGAISWDRVNQPHPVDFLDCIRGQRASTGAVNLGAGSPAHHGSAADHLASGRANTRNPNLPNAVNYDESKANPYPNLPDPLTLNNGKKVTTARVWWKVAPTADRRVF